MSRFLSCQQRKYQYKRLRQSTFNAIVSAHELVGHGCGRLLEQDSTGHCNFDSENPPVSPLTSEPIKTWYTTSQIPKSVFGRNYNASNKCLAESKAELLEVLGAQEAMGQLKMVYFIFHQLRKQKLPNGFCFSTVQCVPPDDLFGFERLIIVRSSSKGSHSSY